jgi:hypothetical protein
MLWSIDQYLAGHWQRSAQLLEQVMALGVANGHCYVTLQAGGMLASRQVRQGHLRQGEQLINQVVQQAERPVFQLTSSLIVAQSAIDYERNQLDEAYKI